MLLIISKYIAFNSPDEVQKAYNITYAEEVEA